MAQTYSDKPTLAAFNAMASPVETIFDFTLTEATKQFDLDVSGIDWAKYTEVVLYVWATADAAVGSLSLAYIWFDDEWTHYYRPSDKAYTNALVDLYIGAEPSFATVRFPYSVYGIRATKLCQTLFQNKPRFDEATFQSEIPTLRSEYQTMHFSSPYDVLAGSRFLMVGIRA